MGSGKGRRGSGASNITANSPNRQQQYEAEGGWPGRVKVLASSTMGSTPRDEGGRTIALRDEDFRKSGFRAREVVAVLAGPSRLIAGRVTSIPSAALRPGGVGLASSSAKSLGCGDGARARVRRLVDTPITIFGASAVELCLEAGPGSSRTMQAGPRGYLERFTAGRRALLERATGFAIRGVHARKGDLLSVSFEGVPHLFRVASLWPRREHPGATAVEAAATAKEDIAVVGMAGLSISDEPGGEPVVPTARGHSAYMKNMPKESFSVGDQMLPDQSIAVTEDSPPKLVRAKELVAEEEGLGDEADAVSSVHERLEAFYREHNPEKLGSVPHILAKYAGREDDLFAKLEKIYGPVSIRAATSGGITGKVERGSGRPAEPPSPTPKQSSYRGDNIRGGNSKTSVREQDYFRSPGCKGDEGSMLRSWGSSESLWLISSDTSIELTAVDADNTCPSDDISRQSFLRAIPSATTTVDAASSQDGGGQAPSNSGDWSSVGGLSKQIEQLREAIQLPLKSPEVLRRYGVRPPRGVLLHGPPGTGKTTLARAAAAACGCHVIVVNGSELMSRFVGESEGALRQTFADASRRAPCLIVFDEVDTLCPRRDQANSEAQRRVVSTMLALLDGVDSQEQVVVIACTNRPQALDPALRRPGRLDSEVEVGVPDAAGRAEILRVLLRGVPHTMDTDAVVSSDGSDRGIGGGVEELAARTHGFVGADLQLLVKEAALQALRRTDGGWGDFAACSGDGEADRKDDVNIKTAGNESIGGAERLPVLTHVDFRSALPLVSPSGLREVAVEVPSVKWGDIGGMEGVKQSLREVVEWPLRHPEAFQRMGMSPPRGVLLYGPPGCSKTLMARALATESGMNFLAVKGPELLSKWLGESERAMQALFKRARAAAPTIIFFDEVDALACKRGGHGEGGAGATERVLTQLLTELDGIQPVKRLVVVAATNRPDVIDPALLRPGRLDRLVYVPPPDMPSRREILRLSLAKVPSAGDVDREELARRTEGFSGAEVVALCREASICALEEDRSATEVRQVHLLEALRQMRPQITPAVLASYASFHGGAAKTDGAIIA